MKQLGVMGKNSLSKEHLYVNGFEITAIWMSDINIKSQNILS